MTEPLPDQPGERPQGARRPRTSMLGWMPGEELRAAQLEERVDWELRGQLIDRLVAGGPLPEAIHLVLAVMVGGLLWDALPRSWLAAWLGAVVVATVVRWGVRERFRRVPAPPDTQYRSIRNSILALGIAWGLGAAVFAPDVTFPQLALVMVVFSGIIAAAPITLVADPASFFYLTGALTIPLAVGFLRVADSREHFIAVLLVALFAGAMSVFYWRTHQAFLTALRTAKRLEFSEAEVARERAFLDALISSAPMAIAVMSRFGRVLGVNPAFEKTFGFDTSEVVGQDLHSLVVPPDETDDERVARERVDAGDTVIAEVRRQRKDGRVFTVRMAAAPVTGVQQGGVFVLYEDISAMKRAERARREAEEQYHQLVESASDLVWRVDREGCWTFLNAAAKLLYGATPDELVGRPFQERSHPDSAARDAARLETVLAGEDLKDIETVHQDVHGNPVHLSFSARPVRDAENKIVGAHGIARDITAQVNAREALQAARDEAERAGSMKSAFLANMSHEIRTPLNGVLGMTELLLASELTPEQQRSAELIRNSGEALLTIINDILDFSKIEADRLDLEDISFDLRGLAETAARMLSVRAAQRGVELVVDVGPGVPGRVRGDAGRLRQVLTNLIGNAVKFTEQGDVVVRVEWLGGGEASADLRMSVKDTGVGIPADKLETIFEDFQQADISTTRKFGGTGLGLAISRRLVRLMGGELQVRSQVGEGSEFWFEIRLPVEEVAAPPGPGDLAVLDGRRALVVDDSAVNRAVVERMLHDVGVEVETAENGRIGIGLARAAAESSAPFDLVVLDGQMPEMDGFTTAEQIRAEPELTAAGLMLCTSAGKRGDGQRCRELGIDAYLVKPLGRNDLLEAAARVVHRHDSGAEPGDHVVTRHSIRESRDSLQVLLAEDNPVNQEVGRAMLRRRGHGVTVVDNGREAVDAVKDGTHFDVILMDIQMPEMDGLAATREIRGLPDGKSISIIAMTAHALSEDRERFLGAGMDGYLAKPFKPPELFAAVEGSPGERTLLEEPGPRQADSAPVDVDGFRAEMRAAGVESAVETTLGVFLEDAPRRWKTLTQVMQGDEAEAIREAAHAFKSACGTIRAEKLHGMLHATETLAADGDVDAVRSKLPAMVEEYEHVMVYLREQMSSAVLNA